MIRFPNSNIFLIIVSYTVILIFYLKHLILIRCWCLIKTQKTIIQPKKLLSDFRII